MTDYFVTIIVVHFPVFSPNFFRELQRKSETTTLMHQLNRKRFQKRSPHLKIGVSFLVEKLFTDENKTYHTNKLLDTLRI